jgi:HD-GYP domain-containing protein (c-di-GMP phosphodiesterase class II)
MDKKTDFKSINSFIKRLLFFSIIIGIIFISSLIILEVSRVNMRKKVLETESGFRTVNNIITEMHKLNNFSLTDGEISETLKNINNQVNVLSEILKKINEEDKVKELENIFNTENLKYDLSSNIRLVGNFARDFRELSNKYNNSFEKMILYSLIISIFSISLIIILIFVYKRYYNRTLKIMDTVGVHLSDVVNFKDEKIFMNVMWNEEQKFLEQIHQIEEEVIFNRNLLNFGIYDNLEILLKKIFNVFPQNFPIDRFSLAFIDNNGNVIAESAVSKYEKIKLDAGFMQRIEETTLLKIVKSFTPRIINDLESHYNNIHKSISTKLLIEEGIKSNLTVPFYFDEKCYGFVFFASKEKNIYNNTHCKFANRVVSFIKHNVLSHYIIQEILAISTNGFVELVEGKDNETGEHTNRVALYSKTIAKELSKTDKSITPRFIRDIYWFAPLHDIGKVSIPDSILLKPGKLTDEEFKIMKTHVNAGEKIIKEVNEKVKNILGYDSLKVALDIVSAHHEKFDGSGYPYGLKGKEIPVAGKIVAIADVFDALTTKRPYKEAFSLEESLDIIKKSSGTHFDPEIIEVFERTLEKIKSIYIFYKDA